MYLIDSDILIDFCRGKIAPQENIYRAGLSNCVVSEISLAEMLVGAYRSGNESEFLRMEKIEKMFARIPLSYEVIKCYAQLRASLETRGMWIANMDLFIAAAAIANDFILVTHNTRHYSRIPGLRLEDWTEEA